jgi:hypothetical protein
MAKIDKISLDEVLERGKITGEDKELIIYCPRVTHIVERDGKKEKKTYFDITDVFNDFEEGKVMGRIWKFGKEKPKK